MTWKIWTIVPALALAACAGDYSNDTEANAADPAPNAGEDGSNASPPPSANGDGGERGGNDREEANGTTMAWHFSTAAPGPKLAYGEPQTDNVRLTLRCAAEQRIELSFMRGSGEGERMTVRSGGAGVTVEGAAEETQLGGHLVTAHVPAAAPPFERFRGGSPLSVDWAGETRTVPPAGAEAERLFEACRAGA